MTKLSVSGIEKDAIEYSMLISNKPGSIETKCATSYLAGYTDALEQDDRDKLGLNGLCTRLRERLRWLARAWK